MSILVNPSNAYLKTASFTSINSTIINFIPTIFCRYEAFSFLLLYMLYILLMYYNTSVGSWLVPKFTCCHSHLEIHEPEPIVMYQKPSENGATQTNISVQLMHSTGNCFILRLYIWWLAFAFKDNFMQNAFLLISLKISGLYGLNFGTYGMMSDSFDFCGFFNNHVLSSNFTFSMASSISLNGHFRFSK